MDCDPVRERIVRRMQFDVAHGGWRVINHHERCECRRVDVCSVTRGRRSIRDDCNAGSDAGDLETDRADSAARGPTTFATGGLSCARA